MELDPFIWLEDLDDPRTREFIEEHNRRFREFTGDLPNRFVDRIRRYYSVPYIYMAKATSAGVYMVVRELGVYSIKLLSWDGVLTNILSSRDLGEHTVITAIYPSMDCRRLGFFYTIAGSDEGFLKIIDPDTMEELDVLKGSVGNIVWVNRDKYYYTRFYRRGETPDGVKAPAERVFLREIPGSEEMVFGRGIGTNYMIEVMEPWDTSRLFIVVFYGWHKSIVYGGLRSDPGSWVKILDGDKYLVKPIGYYNGIPYLVYYDGWGMGRIIRVVDGVVEEVVGENNYPLDYALMIKDEIYSSYLVNASSRLKVYSFSGDLLWEYRFKEPSYIRDIGFYEDRALFILECFSKPPSIHVVEDHGVRELYGFGEKLDLVIKEEWTTSSDGTRIHMFIIENRGRKRDVAIVYGYGGFGISITPFYPSPLISFILDGGVLVVANLRGGSEYGEEWHRMGMRENKQNVFEDYKAVLKHVRDKGLKTIGWGSSNGGLLVAATMVQEPQLFNIALIGYPVIDMLRFHKLYIGRLWTTEYGDPDNPRDREYLIKYSPYHNIREDQVYPPTLVYTGLHDDRVHPGHALKFVAKLERIGAPVYLRVETVSGHMGSTPEIKIREYSDIYAFIYRVLGEDKP